MAFRDTKKNNGYHSLFIKLFGHVQGAVFSGDGVYFNVVVTHTADIN